jgi:hypothetical protein
MGEGIAGGTSRFRFGDANGGRGLTSQDWTSSVSGSMRSLNERDWLRPAGTGAEGETGPVW